MALEAKVKKFEELRDETNDTFINATSESGVTKTIFALHLVQFKNLYTVWRKLNDKILFCKIFSFFIEQTSH